MMQWENSRKILVEIHKAFRQITRTVAQTSETHQTFDAALHFVVETIRFDYKHRADTFIVNKSITSSIPRNSSVSYDSVH